MQSLVDGGADIIELGVPFSDPMADGPTIQRARNDLLPQELIYPAFSCWCGHLERNASTPVILMGYMNPFERLGLKGLQRMQASLAWMVFWW